MTGVLTDVIVKMAITLPNPDGHEGFRSPT